MTYFEVNLDKFRDGVVVDVKRQRELGLNLNGRSLNQSQAVRMKLSTTLKTQAEEVRQSVCRYFAIF